MARRSLTIRLDEELLAKAKAVAEEQGRSLDHMLIEYLHKLVKKDKHRRIREEMMRPYVDRPTVSLRGDTVREIEGADEES